MHKPIMDGHYHSSCHPISLQKPSWHFAELNKKLIILTVRQCDPMPLQMISWNIADLNENKIFFPGHGLFSSISPFSDSKNTDMQP